MRTLTLNDGTVIQNGHVLLSGNTLWFYIEGISFDEAYELMSDPDKTVRIVADSYGAQTEYNGFTDLFCLRREESLMITGALNRI